MARSVHPGAWRWQSTRSTCKCGQLVEIVAKAREFACVSVQFSEIASDHLSFGVVLRTLSDAIVGIHGGLIAFSLSAHIRVPGDAPRGHDGLSRKPVHRRGHDGRTDSGVCPRKVKQRERQQLSQAH
jgi:hypothetical protein